MTNMSEAMKTGVNRNPGTAKMGTGNDKKVKMTLTTTIMVGVKEKNITNNTRRTKMYPSNIHLVIFEDGTPDIRAVLGLKMRN